MFVFSKKYPVDELKEAVVGRLRIDPLVLKVARTHKMSIVDLSSIPSFHQGFTSSQSKISKVSLPDYFFNIRYIGYSEEGRLLANYRVFNLSTVINNTAPYPSIFLRS